MIETGFIRQVCLKHCMLFTQSGIGFIYSSANFAGEMWVNASLSQVQVSLVYYVSIYDQTDGFEVKTRFGPNVRF